MSSQTIRSILSSKPHNLHYLNRYIKFIEYCKNLKQEGYTEKHHICPKAKDLFPEYSSFKENPWNKINLSARQHYVAHLLLFKIYGRPMAYALHCLANMSNSNQKRSKNKLYSDAKEEYSKRMSSLASERNKRLIEEGNHVWQSKTFKDSQRARTSQRNLEKAASGSHPWLSGNRSIEHERKRSEALKGNKNAAGFKHTEEHKKKISDIQTGKPIKRDVCPGCGKEGAVNYLTRCHTKCGYFNKFKLTGESR